MKKRPPLRPRRLLLIMLPALILLLAAGCISFPFVLQSTAPSPAPTETQSVPTASVPTSSASRPADRQAPVIAGVRDQTLYNPQALDLKAGITVTDDCDPKPTLTVHYAGLNLNSTGSYTVTYTATDAAGNVSTQVATITVILDNQPPQIFGVNKLSIYQGSTVSYRKNIVITDDQDPFPRLTIDSSAVNIEVPGTYEVIYTATDAAGNAASVATTITIQEKQPTYVDEAIILAEADKILAQIITEDMTIRQQVEAVYLYSHVGHRWSGSSDKTDRLQAAYHLMMGNGGDCFNYYALNSLLLERLGIPQISVERSASSVRDARHYWSLVSLDGGETWYHVDACPMYPEYAQVCLFTDEQLRYVEQFFPGYYTTDPGKYPETPKEPLP